MFEIAEGILLAIFAVIVVSFVFRIAWSTLCYWKDCIFPEPSKPSREGRYDIES